MTAEIATLIDTHAHLDDEQFGGDLDGVINRAAAAGVDRIINIGYRPARWRSTLDLADRYPCISYTLGLHPHHVDEWSDAVERELLELLEQRRPVAVGEIGLDYFRNFNPANLQRAVFARQLTIAAEFRLPVVIHQRQAEQDLMHDLAGSAPDLVCVLHSFDGTAELAQLAIDRGWYVGVGGLMTRSGSEELRDVLKGAPLDRIVVETDAPYLVPAGVKNRRNEPANVAIVVERLAALHGMSVVEVARATYENANCVFGRHSCSGVSARSSNA